MANELQGHLTFESTPPADFDGVVRVQLLETGRADAPSRIVAEAAIPSGDVDLASRADVPFTLALPAGLSATARYEVRVHTDQHGTGAVKQGDFITMQSYPVVVTEQNPSVAVRVKRV